MLYYNFDGYEGFCCRFGFIEHDNGKTSKKEQDTARLHKGQELTRESDKDK